jgi:hypothetical protein
MAIFKNVNRSILVLSLLCYGVALFLPGLAAREKNPYGFTGYYGYICLIFGWTTVVSGTKYFFPWMANLFYFPALLLWLIPARPPLWGALIPGMGLVLATLTFRIETTIVNEAGHRVAVQPGFGAWLWMASFTILLGGFLFQGHRNESPGAQPR